MPKTLSPLVVFAAAAAIQRDINAILAAPAAETPQQRSRRLKRERDRRYKARKKVSAAGGSRFVGTVADCVKQ